MMRIDELTEIYRVEKSSGSLMTVRSDLYKAIALLTKKLREEYERELSEDPDSIRSEGASLRRKKADKTVKDIIDIRMEKICKMALRGARGGVHTLDSLTPEEKQYYEGLLTISKNHRSILDRLSGKVRYVTPDITEPLATPAYIPIPEAEPPVEEYYEPEDDIPAEEDAPAPVEEPPVVGEGPIDVPLEVIPEAGSMEFEEPEPEQDFPDDELDRIAPMEEKTEVAEPAAPAMDDELTLIRIIADNIPTISGFGNKEYCLKREDVVRMPVMFANVLIQNNMAKKISVSP